MKVKHLFDILEPHDKMRMESARGLFNKGLIPTLREYNLAVKGRTIVGQPIKERKEYKNVIGY